jgi:hypothetical protein
MSTLTLSGLSCAPEPLSRRATRLGFKLWFAQVVVALAAIFTVATPALLPLSSAYAAEGAAAAAAAAEADADADTSGALWFGAGCLLGVIGILVAYVVEPHPQATRLMGKDAEYIQAYTLTYTSAAKSIQTKMALYGCAAGAVTGVVLYVFAIGAAVSSVP